MISFVWLIARWFIIFVAAQCSFFFSRCANESNTRVMPERHGRSEVSSDRRRRRVCKDGDGNSSRHGAKRHESSQASRQY
jgi:hypothetical protein